MDKVIIAFWSQTGNTEEMAQAIKQGVEEAGKQAEVIEVSKVDVSELGDLPAFAIGCPAMGNEELEDSEVEPFVQEVEKIVKGKQIALFGSYGWGDGEWMREWVQRMINAGAEIVGGQGIICTDAPDDEAKKQCINLGKELAAF